MEECVQIVIPTTRSRLEEVSTLKAVADYMRKNPNVKVVVQQDFWRSASKARNEGVKKGRCRVIAFMDDDIYVDPETLDRYVRLAERGYASIICGKGSLSAGIFVLLSRLLVIDRKSFELVGGFDERIVFNQSEDVEFVLSLLEKGVRVTCIDGRKVVHYGKEGGLRKVVLNEFNSSLLILKHPSLIYHYYREKGGRVSAALRLIRMIILPRARLHALLMTPSGRLASYMYYIARTLLGRLYNISS